MKTTSKQKKAPPKPWHTRFAAVCKAVLREHNAEVEKIYRQMKALTPAEKDMGVRPLSDMEKSFIGLCTWIIKKGTKPQNEALNVWVENTYGGFLAKGRRAAA